MEGIRTDNIVVYQVPSNRRIGFMDKKIKFSPAQLTELQIFFQQSDFTANMTLNCEYDFSGEQSHIHV